LLFINSSTSIHTIQHTLLFHMSAYHNHSNVISSLIQHDTNIVKH